MNRAAAEWLEGIGSLDAENAFVVPSTVPEHLSGPILRSPTPPVRTIVAEFMLQETLRRETELREKRRAWLALAFKLLCAWGVVVALIWFQVRNLESMLESFHESTPFWFATLVKLRTWVFVWGPAIPVLGISFGLWLYQKGTAREITWSADDAELLAEKLRGRELPSDVESTAAMILNVHDEAPRSSVLPHRASEIRAIGRSLTIDNERQAQYRRFVIRWPKMLTAFATVGLLTIYLGLTLLPLIWMLDAYLHQSVAR